MTQTPYGAVQRGRTLYAAKDGPDPPGLCGETLHRHFVGAPAHLLVTPERAPDLTLYLWDSASTGVEMPPPFPKGRLIDRGDIWGLNGPRIRVAFHWIECSVNLMELTRFRRILRFLGFPAARMDTLLAIVHDQNLFSGRVEPTSYIRSGQPRQWERTFTRANRERLHAPFGDALIRLGYDRDGRWR